MYYPYGEEITVGSEERLKFTGHERDLGGSGTADDLDYMHARYYQPGLGRFLSVDPVRSADPVLPQSWNRYAYVLGNPLILVGPDGEVAETIFDIGMALFSIGQAIDDPSPLNILGAGLDVAAAALPFVPALGGRAIDAAQAADKLGDAVSAANRADTVVDTIRSTDEIVASSARSGRSGMQQTRGVQSLQKKIDRGDDAFQGLEKTQEAAEQVIREVLGAKDQVVRTGTSRNGEAYTDIFDPDTGRGIRLIDGVFDTFVNLQRK